MIKESEKIGVLNYNENRVSVEVAPGKSYSFEPSIDGETPMVIPMTIEEILYANNSVAFKSGMLFFEKSREEEIYERLNIVNWKDILSNDKIKEILLHPTFDGLNKIVEIKSTSELERVRGVLFKLKQSDRYDVSVRVEQIVNTRYKELLNRQINTDIILTKKDVPVESISSEEMDKLKAQNEAMQKQLEEMQKMMAMMMENQKVAASSDSEKEVKETKKLPGRPKKSE